MESIKYIFPTLLLLQSAFCSGWQKRYGYRPPSRFHRFQRFHIFDDAVDFPYKQVKPAPSPFGDVCGHNSYWNPKQSHSRGVDWRHRGGVGILGGSLAAENEFPWQVYLTNRLPEMGIKAISVCSGSVVSDSWILTSAQCCVSSKFVPFDKVVYGTNELDDPKAETRDIEKMVINPFFEIDLTHDFCLVKVTKPVSFNTWKIKPICLPQSCDDTCHSGELTVASGIGKNDEGEINGKLQRTFVPVANNSFCEHLYFLPKGIMELAAYQCFGNGTSGWTLADDGGPVACYKNGYFSLQGVASFGIVDYFLHSKRHAVVAGNVCQAVDWIRDTIKPTVRFADDDYYYN